jgi:hypothetical protein
MKKIALIIFIPFSIFNAQYVDTFNHEHSLGFGLGNTIALINNFISSSNNRASLFIDYKQRTDSITYLRINIISDLPFRKNQITEFRNCYISAGIEKRMLFIKNKKVKLYYGADIYYKMNIKKNRLIPFSTLQYGFGLIAISGLEFSINNTYSFCTEFGIGLGIHQYDYGYVDPNTGRFLWHFKGVSPKNLSLGLRRHF